MRNFTDKKRMKRTVNNNKNKHTRGFMYKIAHIDTAKSFLFFMIFILCRIFIRNIKRLQSKFHTKLIRLLNR